MKRFLLTLTVILALVASACGDGTDADVGADAPNNRPADDSPVDDSPVDDEPLGTGPYPIADLTITYQLDQLSEAVTYRLACLGDTESVTGDGAPGAAAAMCIALNELPIRDRVVNGAPTDQACTEQHGGPQIASVTGTLEGEAVDTSFDRANGCGISDWALLGAFLPVPS
jgi:hypothetical protein